MIHRYMMIYVCVWFPSGLHYRPSIPFRYVPRFHVIEPLKLSFLRTAFGRISIVGKYHAPSLQTVRNKISPNIFRNSALSIAEEKSIGFLCFFWLDVYFFLSLFVGISSSSGLPPNPTGGVSVKDKKKSFLVETHYSPP